MSSDRQAPSRDTAAPAAGLRPFPLGGRELDLLASSGSWPLVMGIVNVTPDSFSDGGVHFDPERALESALRMEADGADLIDIGGESTRPGSDPVPIEEELRRVVPVIRAIRDRSAIPISIDTRNSRVAREAIEAGAGMVNDVTALEHDPGMAEVVRAAGVPVVLMHMRGEPKTMQSGIRFDDLIGEIHRELDRRLAAALAAGIARERILVDPGIGFGKTFDQNVEILAQTSKFRDLGPVVIGGSRKGFIGHLTGRENGAARMPGSLATVAAAALAGAAIVRVHDVAASVDFLRVLRPVLERRP